MKTPLQITVPEPCHEQWQNMRPDANGRYCHQCQKVVTDFSTMTDAQVLDFLKHNKLGCGRFTTTQLNRPLVAPPKRYSWSMAMMQRVMLGVGMALGIPATLNAQTTNADKQIQSTVGEVSTAKPVPLAYPTVITIQVLDADNRPSVGTSIYATSNNKYWERTLTDSIGNFTLTVPDNGSLEHLTLYVYFENKMATFVHSQNGKSGSFTLTNNRATIQLRDLINLTEIVSPIITGAYAPENNGGLRIAGRTERVMYYIDGVQVRDSSKPIKKSFWQRLKFW